ncbi:hypothetical protein ACRAWD_21430 [Caulobacter segnis]
MTTTWSLAEIARKRPPGGRGLPTPAGPWANITVSATTWILDPRARPRRVMGAVGATDTVGAGQSP